MRTFFAHHRTLALWLLPVAVLSVAVALVATVFITLGATGHLRTRPAPNVPAAELAASSSAPRPRGSGPASPASVSSAASAPVGAGGPAAGGALPRTSDAVTYAVAYATALFSYDTRTGSETAWTASLAAGLDASTDVHADNLADLADRTPPAAVWQTMTASSQRASFTPARAWVPQLWTTNATAYPTGAAAVSVSGTQRVVWAGGSSDVPSSVTLLLVCPPLETSCAVNRIAAQVLQ